MAAIGSDLVSKIVDSELDHLYNDLGYTAPELYPLKFEEAKLRLKSRLLAGSQD